MDLFDHNMIYLLGLTLFLVAENAAYEQTFTAAGKLTCGGRSKPASNIPMVMKNIDKIYKGDVLAKATTDAQGMFKISHTNDSRNFPGNDFRTYVEISHKCDQKKRENCDIVSVIYIPKGYEDKILEVTSFELSKRRNQNFNSCDDTEY